MALAPTGYGGYPVQDASGQVENAGFGNYGSYPTIGSLANAAMNTGLLSSTVSPSAIPAQNQGTGGFSTGGDPIYTPPQDQVPSASPSITQIAQNAAAARQTPPPGSPDAPRPDPGGAGPSGFTTAGDPIDDQGSTSDGQSGDGFTTAGDPTTGRPDTTVGSTPRPSPTGKRPGEGQPKPGEQPPEPWGTPDPRVASQIPPNYAPVSLAPNAPGGTPPGGAQPGGMPGGAQGPGPQQGGGPQQGPGAGQPPAPQGIGQPQYGPAGMSLPQLINNFAGMLRRGNPLAHQVFRQIMAGQRQFGGRPGPGFPGRPGMGFPGRRMMGQGPGPAPQPPQLHPSDPRSPPDPIGSTAGPASGYPGQNYNYFQRAGMQPLMPSQLSSIQTPWGPIMAHPAAARDAQGFFRDLAQAGAPLRKIGSYNLRKMRWSNNWSSHAYGAAFDLDDSERMTPALRNWILNNGSLWRGLLQKWNMGQPLADASGVGGKDPTHVEWRGPRQVTPFAPKPYDFPSIRDASASPPSIPKGYDFPSITAIPDSSNNEADWA